MNRAIISQRITSILAEIERLNNALYAMNTTDIQRYPDNYEVLSTDAALRAERITCRLRHLIYATTSIKKEEYLRSAETMQGIEISDNDGILEIKLPCLLPKRRQRQSTEFLLDPFTSALSDYAAHHTMPQFQHCVVCFSHIYAQELPERRNTARSVVASRKAAMLRKRQTFYLDTNEDGVPMIYEGRVVQARVIGVAEKVLRVEVFGVECTIFARDLSAAWFGDAREYYSVGDRVLVRVLTIDRGDINHISITADIRSVSSAANQSNLDKCVLQGKYAGRVTDVRHGVVFIRLNNGVNAVAHTCYDRRMPGKKDDVSFAVTRLDEERGIAVGIITRIIKQNL